MLHSNLCIVGGLDFVFLCFDTPEHRVGGWRYKEGKMPWHDCWCAVRGPAAWDAVKGRFPAMPGLRAWHMCRCLLDNGDWVAKVPWHACWCAVWGLAAWHTANAAKKAKHALYQWRPSTCMAFTHMHHKFTWEMSTAGCQVCGQRKS